MNGNPQVRVTAVQAPDGQLVGTEAPTSGSGKPGYEFIEDGPHPDEFPSADSNGALPATGSTDVEDALQHAVSHHFTKAKRIAVIKQCNPAALFRLGSCDEQAKDALHFFLQRHAKSKWMERQQHYVQLAALAAAHEAMHPVIDDFYDDDSGFHRMRLVDSTEFDALGFLKCGIRVRPRKGFPPVWVCHRPEYCARCNLNLRVRPAKDEFLPAFEEGKAWYSVTVIGRSNPEHAGVKIEVVGDAKNQPIYQYLFRPADHFRFPKLSKFGVDDPDLRPQIVADALHEFTHWLTDGKYFSGLHMFRDIDLTFFPYRRSFTGIGHTVNCHVHAYGNTSRIFTGKIAGRMWLGCAKLLRHHGGGELCAYPDIALHPLPTPAALERAINYVIKPFKLANWYLGGLQHGCPVRALNGEFYQTAFNNEFMLPGTTQGTVFGNMGQKSGRYYIGEPPPVFLSKQQVARFLERQAADEAYAWEYVRYQNHLRKVAGRRINPH